MINFKYQLLICSMLMRAYFTAFIKLTFNQLNRLKS